MSKYQQIDMIGGQAIDVNSTTQEHQLGLCCKAVDMASTDYGVSEFIYLKGLASIAIGECCSYEEGDYQTVLAVANGVGSIAVAMAATVASEYGWFQIKGRAVMLVAASFAADLPGYLTATPGTIDDAVVAGDRIHRCISFTAIATPAAGQAEVNINYPFVNNIAD